MHANNNTHKEKSKTTIKIPSIISGVEPSVVVKIMQSFFVICMQRMINSPVNEQKNEKDTKKCQCFPRHISYAFSNPKK